jgi:hypothetical protein
LPLRVEFMTLNRRPLLSTSFAAILVLAIRADAQRISPPQPTSHLPCAEQAKSLPALTAAFESGKLPTAADMEGWWVAVGMFGAAANHGREIVRLDCAGITRDNLFEQAMRIDGNSVEPHFIGLSEVKTLTFSKENQSVNFPVDGGGDTVPIERCRLTSRRTLACLVDVYGEATEYKQMLVTSAQVCHATPNDGYCGPP